MMTKITLSLFLLFSIITIQETKAKGVIVYHAGPQLETFATLPDDAVVDDGSHVNIGIMYDQFGLFWMPVYNYSEPRYVLVSDKEDTYWEYDQSELVAIAKDYNITLPEKPSPSLWNRIGLKPVIAILLVFIIWSYIPSKKEPETEESDI